MFELNLFERGQRIGRGRDRAPDHQIGRAGTQGFRRRHHAALVAHVGTCRADARRHQAEIRAQVGTQHGGLLRRADYAIKFAGLRQPRQSQHLVGRRTGNADFTQILGTHAGQHRHRDQQRPLRQIGQRLLRRRHHAAATRRVDVHHPHPQPRRSAARRRHSIGNVVEFQIEKNLEAARHQRPHQFRPRHGEQFLAHLQPAQATDRAAPPAPARKPHRKNPAPQ